MNNKANNETVRTEQTKTEHTKHKVEFTHNEKFCNAVIIGLCVVFIILIIVGIARDCQSDIEPVNKAIVGEVETTSAENTIPTLNFTPAQEKDLSNAIKIPAVSGYDMVAGETTQRIIFENPVENKVLFKIRLYLSDDTLLWKSENFIKPNEKIVEEELLMPLERGVYKNCKLYYDCYTLDHLHKLNGGMINVMINVY